MKIADRCPPIFFDSSALVKFYIAESGTAWVRSFTDSEDNMIHVSGLARVETVSALTRRLRRSDITQAEFNEACDDLQQDFATQYRIVTLNEEIIEDAAALPRSMGFAHMMPCNSRSRWTRAALSRRWTRLK